MPIDVGSHINAGVTGRFVERQRNKAFPLTRWLSDFGT